MKRFIDLRGQIDIFDEACPMFAWYCTVVDKFEAHSGNMVWTSYDDFKADCQDNFGHYDRLMPEWTKHKPPEENDDE